MSTDAVSPPERKRKRTLKDDGEREREQENTTKGRAQEGSASTKKPLRRRPKKHPKSHKLTAPRERHTHKPAKPRPSADHINPSIAQLDGPLLADLFAHRIKRHLGDLTTVETSELQVPSFAFLNTSSFSSAHTLDKLPTYLEKYSPGGKEALSTTSVYPASPHTVVIAASGIRAADVARVLRPFQTKEAAVSKLFAKHIKLAEAGEMVKKTRIGIGIGTPQRMLDLMISGRLELENLRRVVIDGSYMDQKQRTIFDMKEVFVPMLGLLKLKELRQRLQGEHGQKTNILVY
ncbi:MAG: hypothetical protein Q9227_001758 [Pyrenula ochraceoflavens]